MTLKNKIVAAGRALAATLIIALFGAGNLHAQPDPGLPSLLGGDLDEIPPELDVFSEIPSVTGQTLGTATDGWAGEGESSDLFLDQNFTPAPVRSSGTWLRRGFWFVEQDVVVMNRELTNDGYLLGFDLNRPGLERLTVDSGGAGVGASARFTLGRFLYRDRNDNFTRDHFAEFTFLGLGEWNLHGGISATGNSLVLPFDPGLPRNGFNFTKILRFDWESRFNSFEFNYRVRRRLTSDRLVLDSTGEWTRQIDPGKIYSYLFGLRYFTMDESFDFIGLADDPTMTRGRLQVETNNDLIGFQFGGDVIVQRARWNVGVRGKGGAYVNFGSVNSHLRQLDLTITPNLDSTTLKRGDIDVLAFVGEMGVFAAYHLRPNVSLRVAFEALWLSSVASASRQQDFSADAVLVPSTATGVTHLGMSTGVDIYW